MQPERGVISGSMARGWAVEEREEERQGEVEEHEGCTLRLAPVSQASVELGGERIWNMPRSKEPAKEEVVVEWW